MSGKEGGEGPKVTRGLRVTEVVIGRRDGGRGEAERAAAVGRKEELEEESGEMQRGADSWVESTEGESEEGVLITLGSIKEERSNYIYLTHLS